MSGWTPELEQMQVAVDRLQADVEHARANSRPTRPLPDWMPTPEQLKHMEGLAKNTPWPCSILWRACVWLVADRAAKEDG